MSYIEVKNVTKKTRKDLFVEDLSLRIEKNEVFGIASNRTVDGSKLIDILAGVESFSSGEIILDPSLVSGYVPSQSALFDNMTIHENMMFFGGLGNLGKQELVETLEEVLDRVGLYQYRFDLVRQLPNERKKLANIAVSLLQKPDVLFIDEPFHNLDDRGRQIISRLLEELNVIYHMTIVFHSEDLRTLTGLSSRMLLLNEGRVHYEGSVDQFMNQFRVEKRIQLVFEENAASVVPQVSGVQGVLSCEVKSDQVLHILVEYTVTLADVIDAVAQEGMNLLSIRMDYPTMREILQQVNVRRGNER